MRKPVLWANLNKLNLGGRAAKFLKEQVE